MKEILLRITAKHFCAGAVFKIIDENWVCVDAAPIISYMIGWTSVKSKSYCDKKGWEYETRRPLAQSIVKITSAEKCEWKDDDYNNWWTSCGKDWCFTNDNGPNGNGMNYCPFCGKPLVESFCKWFKKVKAGDKLRPKPDWNKMEIYPNQLPDSVEVLDVMKATSLSCILFTVRTMDGNKRNLDADWFFKPNN